MMFMAVARFQQLSSLKNSLSLDYLKKIDEHSQGTTVESYD